MTMRSRMIILSVIAIATVCAHAQTPTCPFPVLRSLACDNGAGCKQVRWVQNCDGPLSITKCQYSGTIVNCCGQNFQNAAEFGSCGGNGGPVGASLKEIDKQPLFVQAQVLVPRCDGSFNPLPKSQSR